MFLPTNLHQGNGFLLYLLVQTALISELWVIKIKKHKYMTRTEFENQWNRDFAGLPPLTGMQMPSFDEFRISERMREDYLDIFRGENTREGDIEMPYDHPFFDKNGNPVLTSNPLIKYILILEAIPPLNPPLWNNCLPIAGDENNSYIFNITHEKSIS